MTPDVLVKFGAVSSSALLFGCASAVATDSVDAEAASAPAAAIVVVERTTGPGDATRTEAVGRFVQMRAGAVDDSALRMVGAAEDFPPLGACSAVRQPWSDAPARAVRLADVGTVTLESGGVRTNLVARQVPDVADLVSGVVYAARGDTELGPQALYVLRVSGAAEVDAFEVIASAPAEPSDVHASVQDGGLVLTWDPGSSDDVVHVDVAPNDAASPAVRCLFADDGHASIGAAALGNIEGGTLSVHRVHREVFRSKGLASGEVRFDFARALAFTRR